MNVQILEGWEGYTDFSQGGTLNGGPELTYGGSSTAYFGTLATGLSGRGKSVLYNHHSRHPTLDMPFVADSKITFAHAIRWEDAYYGEYVQVLDELGNRQFGLKFDISNRLLVLGEGSAVVATSETAIVPHQIYRITLAADATTGNLIGSINGHVDTGLNVNAIDIVDSAVSSLYGSLHWIDPVGGTVIAGTHTLDDIILGTGECVDWGPMEIQASAVTADLVTEWTRLSGASNYAMVSESPADGDTTYNHADTLGMRDIFSVAAMPAVPDSILAMAVSTLGKKEESAARNLRHLLRIGATDYHGADIAMLEAYHRDITIFQNNPATGVAWTPAERAALVGAGYEHR